MTAIAAWNRVASVIADVVRQAVHDAGARGVVLLDDGSPEAGLAYGCCVLAVGEAAVHRVGLPEAAVLEASLADAGVALDAGRAAQEVHRLHARLVAAARESLVANPVNKTALLLGGPVPPDPLLPLGDVYASQILQVAGAWSAPAAVRRLAEEAGGVDRLDAVLVAWLEERRPFAAAMASLDGDTAAAVRKAFEDGRFGRRRVGLVPKLGYRTPGIDLIG